MSDTVSVQKRIRHLDVSPQFENYSKVIIHVSDDVTYEYGNDMGRTLEIDNPFGSQQMAQDILARLQGYLYQPYEAEGTIMNPAAEMGDALDSPMVYGGIYTRHKSFGRLISADVSAPHDEEINHEYEYESPEHREFKRTTDELSARIDITEESITSEVERATQAEGTLTSQITQQAEQISAKVSSSGGNNSSFAWTLDANGFTLTSNGTQVMKCDSGGLTITGKITASEGKIGGFDIGANALTYKGMDWSNSENKSTGAYIGTSGIRLGKNFTVNMSGNLTAKNATITGQLTVGTTTYSSAANLFSGANTAYNNSSTWSTGAGYGYNYKDATTSGTSSYPTYFKCSYLTIAGGGYISMGGVPYVAKTATINGVTIKYLGTS